VAALLGLRVTYSVIAPARTRCPSPLLAENQPLAVGGMSLAQLQRPSFTLRLTGARPLHDDGYLIDERATLSFTLGRGRVREHTLLAPAP